MGELFEFIVEFLKIIFFTVYYLIVGAVFFWAYYKIVAFIRRKLKSFFDVHYYGQDSDDIPYSTGAYLMAIVAVFLGLGVLFTLILFFNALIGNLLYIIMFLVGLVLISKRFKNGYRNN